MRPLLVCGIPGGPWSAILGELVGMLLEGGGEGLGYRRKWLVVLATV